jgi:hypothetical protein
VRPDDDIGSVPLRVSRRPAVASDTAFSRDRAVGAPQPSPLIRRACARPQKYHSAFGGDVDARKKEYADMVNKYYDLSTSFYEYGAPPRSRWAALRRY